MPGPGVEIGTLFNPEARGAHQTTAPTRLNEFLRRKLDYKTIRLARTNGQRDMFSFFVYLGKILSRERRYIYYSQL